MQVEFDPIGADIAQFISSARKLQALDWDENILERRLVSSLFVMQLVAFVEKRFRLTIADVDLDVRNFSSVNAVRALVKRKQAAAGSAADCMRA